MSCVSPKPYCSWTGGPVYSRTPRPARRAPCRSGAVQNPAVRWSAWSPYKSWVWKRGKGSLCRPGGKVWSWGCRWTHALCGSWRRFCPAQVRNRPAEGKGSRRWSSAVYPAADPFRNAGWNQKKAFPLFLPHSLSEPVPGPMP